MLFIYDKINSLTLTQFISLTAQTKSYEVNLCIEVSRVKEGINVL